MSIGPLGPGGPGQWDDLFARFFGAAEPRRAQRIDITKYMSNDAREVLSAAARRAAELAGADPEALLAALGRPSRRPEDPMPEQVALTPAAKRALLDSLQISRALGASYVGPEHILMALGVNPDSAAGRLMAGRLDPQALNRAEAQPGAAGGG